MKRGRSMIVRNCNSGPLVIPRLFSLIKFSWRLSSSYFQLWANMRLLGCPSGHKLTSLRKGWWGEGGQPYPFLRTSTGFFKSPSQFFSFFCHLVLSGEAGFGFRIRVPDPWLLGISSRLGCAEVAHNCLASGRHTCISLPRKSGEFFRRPAGHFLGWLQGKPNFLWVCQLETETNPCIWLHKTSPLPCSNGTAHLQFHCSLPG